MKLSREEVLNTIKTLADVLDCTNKKYYTLFDFLNRAYRLGYYAGKNQVHPEDVLIPKGATNKPREVK